MENREKSTHLQASPFVHHMLMFLIFLNTYIVTSIFRVREYGSDSIDFQIVIKLAVWLGSLTFVLLLFKKWGGIFFKKDNILLFLLFALLVASCFWAPRPGYSLACVMSMVSVISLIACASCTLKNEQVFGQIYFTFTVIALFSLIVYYINPAFGRMPEWHGGKLVIGPRLTGVTSTANAIGFAMAFALIIAYYYRRLFLEKFPKLFVLSILLNSIALIMSHSRTSLAALFLSILVVQFLKPSYAKAILVFGGIAFVIFALISVDINWLMSLVSRSGDASEITSATGRSDIWHISLKLIAERPFMGWGYGSTIDILPRLSAEIGFSPAHTHNLFLQVLFAAGYPALFLFAALCVVKFGYFQKNGDDLKKSLLIFLLLTGLTEASAFHGVAGSSLLLFATVFAMRYSSFRKETPNGSENDFAY